VVRKLILYTGGSFDQIAATCRWIKLDDVQTGHHSMNLALPIEVIKRIEIIKGPASRVFGQNALQAVNIVTKDRLIMMLHYVFRRVLMASLVLLTAGVSLNESNHILHFQKHI
jgi:iron complex outermembrane receptor protein